MFNYLVQDFKARNISKIETFMRLFIDRGVSAVFIYRLSSWSYHHKLRLIAIILKQVNIFINHCDIAYQSKIGKGLKINHALGIVISECTIGENFAIFQHATVGKNGAPDETGRNYPTIGNNVTCATGSVVAGSISIGNNTVIGANTVVLKDLPANSKAIGSKMTIL